MKIVDAKTYAVENANPARGGQHWVFVKLITDTGIEGVGEPVRIGFETPVVVHMIKSMADRHIIGMDPFDIEAMWRRMYSGTYRPGAAHMGIISGFEMACWDIICKAVGRPVYNLLGGKYREKIRSYTYIYPAPDDVKHRMFEVQAIADLAAERAAAYLKMGF